MVSPLLEETEGRRLFPMAFQNPRPVPFRFLKERVAVDVVHENNSEHGGQSREAPITPDSLLHDHDQKVGDECHPDLYLYGIGTLPVEVPQRKVLLELLEEQLYLIAGGRSR